MKYKFTSWKDRLKGSRAYRALLETKKGKMLSHNLELFIKNRVIKELINDIELDDIEEIRTLYSLTPSFIQGYEAAMSDLEVNKRNLKGKYL